ncbi:MAG: hypothetical protein LUD22_02585 [Coprobacillus sp.]|nr:hypothetical protein [Coprobacillus sp.]
MNNEQDYLQEEELTAEQEVEVYDIYEEIEEDSSPFIDSDEELYLLDDEI